MLFLQKWGKKSASQHPNLLGREVKNHSIVKCLSGMFDSRKAKVPLSWIDVQANSEQPMKLWQFEKGIA